jgi:hypothetical protein
MRKRVARCKGYVRLRETTPAERWQEIAWLTLGGAYSLLYWFAVGVQLWRLCSWL